MYNICGLLGGFLPKNLKSSLIYFDFNKYFFRIIFIYKGEYFLLEMQALREKVTQVREHQDCGTQTAKLDQNELKLLLNRERAHYITVLEKLRSEVANGYVWMKYS